MKSFSLLAALLIALTVPAFSAEKETRVFELRTYTAAPGKLDALHARFRDHTMRIFAEHGITSIGYWVPIENPENKLVYVLAYPSVEKRDASKKAFSADPDWKKVVSESEANGKLVTKVEHLFLSAADYSPPIQPSTGNSDRIFELRTYTTTPGNLPALHARFREHTTALFTKHGMINLFYWQPTPDQTGADNTLVYMLAHASADAAKTSWDAFRADPVWIAAKKASEDKAGGSLTVPDGVKSVFLKATDYSPTR